jgi:GTP pyrophosphokinase
MNAIKKAPPVDQRNIKNGQKESEPSVVSEELSGEREKIDRKAVFLLTETNFRKNFIVSSCCNPLPGDDVFGYVTEKEEVEVHKRSCQTGLKLKSSFGDRIIAVKWGDYRQYSFLASMFLRNRPWDIRNYTVETDKDEVVNIQSVNVSTNDGIFEAYSIYMSIGEEVNQLCAKIAKVDGVSTVHRSTIYSFSFSTEQHG